jgi:hypothetical protein
MGLDLMVGRVSRAVSALLVPLMLAGGVLAGRPGALGVRAGGLISLASFTWLARGVRSSAKLFAGGRAHPLWALGLALRYVLLFGAVALLLGYDIVHPLALVAGLSVLPPVLIAFGLRAARTP